MSQDCRGVYPIACVVIVIDDGDMTDTHNTQSAPPRRSLHRSERGSILAGVSAGLGEHFGINAWWFRWAFIVLAFFGGLGILLYVLAWLLIPGQDEDQAAAVRWIDSVDLTDTGTILGIVLIGAASIVIATQVIDISGSVVFAAILFVVGVLLYRGDLAARPTNGPTGEPPSEQTSDEADDPADRADVEPAAERAEEVGGAASAVATSLESGDSAGGPPPAQVPAKPKRARPPKPPREPSMLGRITIAVVLIVVSVMALLEASGISIAGSAPGDLFDPVHYGATALAIVGIGLVVGAFVGRARWLIVVGILMLPVLLLSSVWPRAFDWTAGDQFLSPETASDVRSDYSLGAGRLELDLRGLSAEEIAGLGDVDITVGAGEVVVTIPSDAGFTFDGEVGLGQIEIVQTTAEVSGGNRGGEDEATFVTFQTEVVDTRSGVNPQLSFESESPPRGLKLDIELGAGKIQIRIEDKVDA